MSQEEGPPPFVVFSTPTLRREFCAEYLMSALATQHACLTAGISTTWRLVGGDPFIAKVRSRMATEFLRDFPTATDLFFLDDDMGWPAEKVVEFIRRPEDIVVGAYPKKSDLGEYPIELAAENDKPVFKDGLAKVNLAPTGFMRIKRRVIEKMAEGSGIYINADEVLGDMEVYDLFRMGYIEYQDNPGYGKWWGEDFFFSSRWRALGGEIWCDPDIDFSHRGTKTWTGNFKSAMTARGLLPNEQQEIAA